MIDVPAGTATGYSFMYGDAVVEHEPSAGSSATVSALTVAGTMPRAVAENGPV